MTAIRLLRSTLHDRLALIVCHCRRSQSTIFHCLIPFAATHRLFAAAALLPLAWTVTSTLAVFPHELSYFSEIAGGPLNGPAHLLDGNIDWGQDLLELKRWCDRREKPLKLRMNYFGFTSARVARIGDAASEAEGVSLESLRSRGPILRKTPTVCFHALSINELYGYRFFDHVIDIDQHESLRTARPASHAGYSISLYVVDDRSKP